MKTSRINYNKYGDYIISMRKFLEEFVYPVLEFSSKEAYFENGKLNISKKQLAEIDSLNHWDITDLEFPFIKRIPDAAVNKDDIFSGKVLLVESSGLNHRGSVVCAYKRPFDLLYFPVEKVKKVADTKRLSRKKR